MSSTRKGDVLSHPAVSEAPGPSVFHFPSAVSSSVTTLNVLTAPGFLSPGHKDVSPTLRTLVSATHFASPLSSLTCLSDTACWRLNWPSLTHLAATFPISVMTLPSICSGRKPWGHVWSFCLSHTHTESPRTFCGLNFYKGVRIQLISPPLRRLPAQAPSLQPGDPHPRLCIFGSRVLFQDVRSYHFPIQTLQWLMTPPSLRLWI